MDTFFYYGVLRKTIVQVASIFNDIKVAKFDSNGNIIKYITVPIKFATKDKAYQAIMDTKRTRPLPMIALSMYAINHDQARIAHKSQYITISKNFETGTADTYLSPVPYNIDFQMTIMTKYIVEMDQIIEQILSYFNPFVFVRIKLDELGSNYFDVKVLYTSATPETALDMGEQEQRLVSWTLYFTAYTYFFTQANLNDTGGAQPLVKKVITKYYTSEDAWENQGTETSYTSGASGSYESESRFLKAIGYIDDEVEYEEHKFSIEDRE